MNSKLIFKMLFLVVILLLLVLMGMHNQKPVDFALPPLTSKISQPAAIMYYAFFAVGLLTGTVLTAGGSRKGGGGSARGGKE